MRVDEFDYQLDESRIARRPAEPRESAKLLLSASTISDHTVGDLPALLGPDDLLVFNDTKVIPARLFGQRGMAKIELLLHCARDDGNWEAFAKPMKRLHTHDCIMLGDDFSADVLGRIDDRVVIRFNTGNRTLSACLEAHGHMPLPPYFKRDDDARDRHDYQSIFAQKEGAVAAPTASLHFTPKLLEALKARGIKHTYITLHVGAGTFQPVRVEDTRDHKMHSEWAGVSTEAADIINATKAKGGRIIAVGTTVLRTLESCATPDGKAQTYSKATDIFITPGYHFKLVDGLVTNFHLPQSTLIMLVAALVGMERMRAIYTHAIDNAYRFYSYGDTSLLWKENN